MKIYHHPRCSTCRKALAFLKKNNLSATPIDLTEKPPTQSELRRMVKYLDDRAKLFNTSGKRYRELKLTERRHQLSEGDVIALLSKEPMLVKRPFLIADDFGLVGFKENEWANLLIR